MENKVKDCFIDNNIKEEKNIIIVNRLKSRMKELGINARQLAEKSNVGRSFVYDILNGKSKNPTSNKLNLICSELQVPISYLLNEKSCIKNFSNYYCINHFNSEDIRADILIAKKLLPYLDNPIDNTLSYYRVCDDSMEPIIHFNSIVIINKHYQSINNGIFLIKDNIGYSLRRVESILGTDKVTLIPENTRYNQHESSLNNLQIIGKVCNKFVQM